MLVLRESVRAWGTPEFQEVLKREIEGLDASQLPLQQGLTTGSYALDEGLRVIVIGVRERLADVQVRAGIFYTSLIAGCSCADDPTPVEPQNEYGEVQIDIDTETGEAVIALADPEGPDPWVLNG
jgi:hypothetical protein